MALKITAQVEIAFQDADKWGLSPFACAIGFRTDVFEGRLFDSLVELLIAVTFHEDQAEYVGDNNDQSGDRAVTTSARNGVTNS